MRDNKIERTTRLKVVLLPWRGCSSVLALERQCKELTRTGVDGTGLKLTGRRGLHQSTLSHCLLGAQSPASILMEGRLGRGGASPLKSWMQELHAASGPALKFHVVWLTLLLLSKVFKTMIFVIYSTFPP